MHFHAMGGPEGGVHEVENEEKDRQAQDDPIEKDALTSIHD